MFNVGKQSKGDKGHIYCCRTSDIVSTRMSKPKSRGRQLRLIGDEVLLRFGARWRIYT